MLVSIIIRTLNESRYLSELLESIRTQDLKNIKAEVVLVDSGSTDGTLEIAQKANCVMAHIHRDQFSFGRSLNIGCEHAQGNIFILISGHCVPTSKNWLQALCDPIIAGMADYTYGRQIGGPETRFSESQIFAKYFPATSRIPQQGFFCNNANSALSRAAWEKYRFDEELTGLEDMDLGRRLHNDGGRIGYVAEACVYHYHRENWAQVRRRFERESIALQKILPQIHVNPIDTLRYITTSIIHDLNEARAQKKLLGFFAEIIQYRIQQYIGSYIGNHRHRVLSRNEKDKYFYPAKALDKYEESNQHPFNHGVNLSKKRRSTL